MDIGVSGVRRSFQSAVGSPQFAVRNLQGVSGVVALCSWQSAVGKPLDTGVSRVSRNTPRIILDKGVSGVRRSRTPEKTPLPAYGPLQVGPYAGKFTFASLVKGGKDH